MKRLYALRRRWRTVLMCVLMLTWLDVKAQAEETGVIEIPVSVLAEGSEPDWNAVYTVELVALEENCPMPEGSQSGVYRMAVKGGSTGTIRLTCEKTGKYEYYLRQIPGKDPDCTYDDRIFRMDLDVSADGIRPEVYEPEGMPETDILFRNRWAAPAWITFSGWVTMDTQPPEDGMFTLRLLAADGETLSEAKNQGKYVMFPALRFKKEGLFRYELKQVAEPGKGIVYDRAVYTLTVSVRREGDYLAETVCSRNGETYTGTPCFANYTEGSIPQTGDAVSCWIWTMLLSAMALTGLGIKVWANRAA